MRFVRNHYGSGIVKKVSDDIAKPQCPQGDAYKDNHGNYFICSNSNTIDTCPPNYECHFDGYLWGCCPTKDYTCLLPFNKGVTCDIGSSYRFFYNSQRQECESFLYNGCSGNSNNFLTNEQCENYCGDNNSCPNSGTPKRNEFGKWIDCSSCPSTHECTSLTSNNSVMNGCCPKRAYICSLPLHQGNSCGMTAVTRFYFNVARLNCIEFTYNGCGGNLNNFASLDQCNNFCLSSACPSGDITYINPSTLIPLSCRTDMTNSCPNNFTCTYDELFGRNVCCGATNMEVCPNDEKAYMNTFNMSVHECLINISNSCPNYYLCRFHFQTNRYYCCTSINGELCPRGKALYKDQSSNLPIRCIISSESNQCPQGYSCLSEIPGAVQGYCCSSNYLCPNRARFYTETISGMPRSCQLSSPFVTCPIGYTCQSTQTEFTTGYCCENDNASIVSDGCPPKKYVYMRDNQVISCDPFNSTANACPIGYSCQWSFPKQRYQCCGEKLILGYKITKTCPEGEVLIAGECLEQVEPGDLCVDDKQCLGGSICKEGICECHSGHVIYRGKCIVKVAKAVIKCSITSQVPYREKGSNKVRYCSISKNNCPKGYSCQYSRDAERNICCGHSSTSITGRRSSSKPTNARRRLKVITDVCENGIPYILKEMPQTCTAIPCPTGFDYIQHDDCPSGTALLFPATGTPLQCDSAKQSSCPSGYRCLRTIKNSGYQCCTLPAFHSLKEEFAVYNPISRFYETWINAIPCPGNQVQVKRLVNGQYLDFCEDRCPAHQIPVNGFCKSQAEFPIEMK
ncbi:hypothetical protein LOAG_18918 [Loa loa]|uniref:Kunitz/Bovine pancreatic trypsin inhibitor domain protein n=1 Tax=Loa loa TaxID=7209 RepID=A0A1I7V967_LOALO|nr:hypothetical protein LOAG_18918 [Loa loa]EJD73670.1 hypothetical protein LOAG_18918 [Loa loa]